ncbi:MAG: hypothetical protein RL071_5046 [Pseudomonadota bacterium]|jgi:hypothetical protein
MSHPDPSAGGAPLPAPIHLDLHGDVYSAAGIDAAAAAYAGLLAVERSGGPTLHRLALRVQDAEVDDLVDHFLNHALHASVTLARRGAVGASA